MVHLIFEVGPGYQVVLGERFHDDPWRAGVEIWEGISDPPELSARVPTLVEHDHPAVFVDVQAHVRHNVPLTGAQRPSTTQTRCSS